MEELSISPSITASQNPILPSLINRATASIE